ncbi:MAG: hypothetical protein JKY88_03180 [Pseudomonadales bacterium]|nr:hypothetical protein [Pseudomonadales bacterium]
MNLQTETVKTPFGDVTLAGDIVFYNPDLFYLFADKNYGASSNANPRLRSEHFVGSHLIENKT